MSISIINTSEINREELWENIASSVWEDSLTKQWSEYVLETPNREINFRENPNLIQRIKFDDDWLTIYDYMWSSEFEWWAVWKTVWKLIEWQNKWELVLFTCDDWIEWLCHISMVKEAKEQAFGLIEWDKNQWLNSNFRLQEELYSERFSNFLCLDNVFFFSTWWEALKYLQHLDYTALRKNYIRKIQDHPKYIELNWLTHDVYSFLRENWIYITFIGLMADRVLNITYEKWTIEDKDFKWAIWLNSNNRKIHTWSFSEEDLLDALELKWRLFTDTYWLENWNFLNVAWSNWRDSIEKMVDIFVWFFNWGYNYKYSSYSREQIMSDIDDVMNKLVQNSSLNRQTIDKLVLSWFFDHLLAQNGNAINYLITLAWNVHASEKDI